MNFPDRKSKSRKYNPRLSNSANWLASTLELEMPKFFSWTITVWPVLVKHWQYSCLWYSLKPIIIIGSPLRSTTIRPSSNWEYEPLGNGNWSSRLTSFTLNEIIPFMNAFFSFECMLWIPSMVLVRQATPIPRKANRLDCTSERNVDSRSASRF
ncbi:hypothetical protein OGATHE_005113 [Ogataea polymorpha]|uniref:Uncharacterized protein n=1 Tax=Ogataea polymorpha TaxID=460523 RepID=A0A9P8SZU5_9ASCO|nr:hypothetical protein OGATHE_005113 [Ogataea polymorpha]